MSSCHKLNKSGSVMIDLDLSGVATRLFLYLFRPKSVCKISLSFRLSFSLSDMTNYKSAYF